MPFDLQVSMTGLIAYTIHDPDMKTHYALILASRKAGHDHPDQHHALLTVSTEFLQAGKKGSAPDFIFDAGGGEYAAWCLDGYVLHVLPDGKTINVGLDAKKNGSGSVPTPQNQDSLYWLPRVSLAAHQMCRFRKDCLPPKPKGSLVAAAVRVDGGRVRAQWPYGRSSKSDPKKERWAFVGSAKMPSYEQALADGITWRVQAREYVQLRLQYTREDRHKSIFLTNGKEARVAVSVSNKPSTIDGKPSYEPQDSIHHYRLYYDLVEPKPDTKAHRIPQRVGARAVQTNRCPGTA